MLSQEQKDLYNKQQVYEIYPEYWIIKAEVFDEDKVKNKLDEWVYFLKTGDVQDKFTAQGLSEAKVQLDKLKLKPKQRAEYEAYESHLMRLASYRETEKADVYFSIKKAETKKEIEIAIEMYKQGLEIELISTIVKKPIEEVRKIIEEFLKSTEK